MDTKGKIKISDYMKTTGKIGELVLQFRSKHLKVDVIHDIFKNSNATGVI